jgi:hypothetical protein
MAEVFEKLIPPLTHPIGGRAYYPTDIFSTGNIDSCTTGLNLSKSNDGKYSKIWFRDPNKIMDYLDTLTYEPFSLGNIPEDQDAWDCEDRAYWGIAHVRFKYPGFPIGVAEGKNDKGQDHAVIILWYQKDDKSLDYLYYDPTKQVPSKRRLGKNFGVPYRITAFPVAPKGQKEAVPPQLENDSKESIYGHHITLDDYWFIYPLRTKDKKGILDFLEGGLYNTLCIDRNKHRTDNDGEMRLWGTNTDYALWVLAHLRRHYPGCAVGVAIGQPVGGKGKSVNVLWYREGDTEEGKISKKFWDPHPEMNNGRGGLVDFTIEASFM